jgi:hypothetical protein
MSFRFNPTRDVDPAFEFEFHEDGSFNIGSDDRPGPYSCGGQAEAEALRNLLIERYPLPVKPVEPAPPKVRYEVGANAKVYRIVPTVKDERFVVGEFYISADAEAFANMKNAEA